jgi:hypothetical protein
MMGHQQESPVVHALRVVAFLQLSSASCLVKPKFDISAGQGSSGIGD